MSRIPTGKPTPRSILKHALTAVLLAIAAGCSGSSCGGGCTSCSTFTPLPGGFEPTDRIENSGSVRVTPSGLNFLQTNLGGLAANLLGAGSGTGIINFAIPKISGSDTITYTVCPNGSNLNSNPELCYADINIGAAALKIASASPSELTLTGTLPIRVEDIDVNASYSFISGSLTASLDGDGSCPGTGSYAQVPLDVILSIQIDTNTAHTANYGYTAVSVKQIVDKTTITNALDNDINFCGGITGDIANFGPIKDAIVGQVVSQLESTLQSELDSKLCQTSASTPCPTGTTADSSMVCRYADGSCASILLGTQGHANVGSLLSSISPGTTGGLDVLFAGGGSDLNPSDPTMMLHWGDLDPVDGGATIGLYGGVQPNPTSQCVPLANVALPTGIPIPDELLGAGDAPANWPANYPGPDVEIAVSERFANYALASVYSSGLLCIGISTETIPLLSSSTIGLLAPSSKTLALQEEPQQIAVVIRPSQPPTVTFGNGTNLTTDPNLLIDIKQASLDFYVFSLDRFIRFMTATFDLSVPVNVTVSPEGFTPVLNTINVANGTVTNSQLLSEDPAQLASAIGGLLGSVVGQELSGSLKAFNLNTSLSSLGVQLFVPDTVPGQGSPGLVKLTKNSDNFLGIFASFGLAGAMPPVAPKQHTNLQLVRKSIDPAGLRFETLAPGNAPVVEILADSGLIEATRGVEYQYRIDQGFWHPFQASRVLTIQDDWLRVQGRHTLFVRSRYADDFRTLDEIPAALDFTIDAQPPTVKVRELPGNVVKIEATDRVTDDPLVRYQLDGGPWSEWLRASRLPLIPTAGVASISVEAQDNDGNLGKAQEALIRGVNDGPTAAGCGNCNAASGDASPGGGLFALLGISALFARGAQSARARRERAAKGAASRRSVGTAIATGAAVLAISSASGCSCSKAEEKAATTTGTSSSSSGTPSCPSCTELDPGLIGEYSSAAVDASGTIWVAGYSEADYNNDYTYGDLVVGKWNGTKVDWKQVDGVPNTPAVDCTMFDCNGFRGGQTAPGNDVGLWTSIVIGPDGNPAVAYYDRTNLALKFAQYNGKTWAVQTVDSVTQGDVGRYAKMLLLNGNFVIAYEWIAPGGMNGAIISKVRVATSAGSTPAASSWTFDDAVINNNTPCRASYCTATQSCVSTTGQCTATLDSSLCDGGCASGDGCVTSADAGTAACLAIYDTTKIDAYPDATGDYVSLAPDNKGGFGISYYDRTAGNLMIASKSSGTWTTLLVDGEGTGAASQADCGIGSNLVIDANGDWNLTYVNGYTEALQYVKVVGGTTVGTPEIVDNGYGVTGSLNADGLHVVGDDSHMLILPSGEIHITYADSTAGVLHYAVGTVGSMGHTWTVRAVPQTGFAGAFSNIVVANGQTQLMNWWRVGGASVAGDVRLLPPP